MTVTGIPVRHDAPGDRAPIPRAAVRDGGEEGPEHQRCVLLGRRLRRVLFDLGLDQVLDGWVAPTSSGLAFADLPFRQADRLVYVLEDVVGGRPGLTSGPGPAQLRLF